MEKASSQNLYHFNPVLAAYSRENRKAMPKSAILVWKHLLSRSQFLGYKFKRERPILNYIADFFCAELLLVVEIDGITHDSDEQQAKDKERDCVLASVGITTLRFSAWEAFNDRDYIYQELVRWVDEHGPRDGTK